jgi:hypothetical protein
MPSTTASNFSDKIQLANLVIEVITDHVAIRTLLKQDILQDFPAIAEGKSADSIPVNFTIELLTAPSATMELFPHPVLPLKATPMRLKRERLVEGWVVGDLMHVEDGLHHLDLDYQAGCARGFFTNEILQTPKLLTRTYFLLALVELLRTREVYFIHGACVVNPQGRGIMLLGDGGVGKSTTVYILARQGWSYVADDTMLMFLDESGRIAVTPLLRRFLLHGMLVHRFPGLALEKLEADGKGKVAGSSPGVKNNVIKNSPERVMVLSRNGNDTSKLFPISKSTLLAELIRQNAFLFLHNYLATKHLSFLSQFTKQCDAFRLELCEDILVSQSRLPTLLGRHERAHEKELYF